MLKRALITGITGQDGSYLTEYLLEQGYEVHGLIRRSSTFNTKRIDHLYQDPHLQNVRLFLHYGDMTDASSLSRMIEKYAPDEIYNLAAQSHVRVSFDMPEYTGNVDALGTLRLLDAIRDTGVPARFYQASTSELFGKCEPGKPQDENTPFHPCSPYAAAKLYAYWIVRNYREAYGLFAVNGILFNHESPRRGETFITRKITMAAAKIHAGLQDCLYVGNLNASRDWGYAPDYVKMMHKMLQQEQPDDYVAATGETHTVREFIESSFGLLGHSIRWDQEKDGEIGIDQSTGKVIIRQDPRYRRPSEVDYLLGNAAKARKYLGWAPIVTFRQLVEIMTKADVDALQKGSGI